MQQLQGVDFAVQHVAGEQNKAADALSRLPGRSSALELAVMQLETLVVNTGGDFLKKVAELSDSDPWLWTPGNTQRLVFDGRHWFSGKCLYVPAGMGLRSDLVREAHDVESGHLGVARTYAALQRRFWWPNMHKDVKFFVETCAICAQAKPSTLKEAGSPQPLTVPTERWKSIATDIVTGLPKVRGMNAAIVFIDRFSKYAIVVPVSKKVSAEEYADALFQYVICVHGLPDEIVSDRDPRFTAGFWQAVLKRLGTKIHLSTAYHPQSDGSTERLNRTWTTMLRVWCMRQQRQWLRFLPIVVANYNNSRHTATKFTPNYLVFGREVQTPLDKLVQPLHCEQEPPAADAFIQQLQQALENAKRALQHAYDVMEKQLSQKRRDLTFRVGEKVWLSSKHITLSGNKKLKPRYVGPFTITKVVFKNAYKLALPSDWEIHPVFNVSLLKPYKPRQITSDSETTSESPATLPTGTEQPVADVALPPTVTPTVVSAPVPLNVDPAIHREPERISRKRVTGRGIQYLVKFKELGEEENKWLGPNEVSTELVQEYLNSVAELARQTEHTTDVLDTFSSDDEPEAVTLETEPEDRTVRARNRLAHLKSALQTGPFNSLWFESKFGPLLVTDVC